jgi:hypothetical protein
MLLPIFMHARTLNELPKFTKSNTLVCEPNRMPEYMLMELPQRKKERTESAEPNCR